MNNIKYLPALFATVFCASCNNSFWNPASQDKNTAHVDPKAIGGKMEQTNDAQNGAQIKIEVTKQGTGQESKEGDLVSLIYTGKLTNGTIFDSNNKENAQPLSAIVGQGKLIPGFEKGILGLKAGEERKITIPWQLAYGKDGIPPTIPPSSDLVFEIKVLKLIPKGDLNKVEKQDVTEGKGAEAKTGNTVEVHYTGKFANDTVFDTSIKRGQTFSFKLGDGRVIKGWDIGVVGMKVGGKRKLIIPPSLGYGENGYASIGPNQPLIFEIELHKVD